MTPEELEQIAETERAEQKKFAHSINVCVAAGCVSCQSQSVKDAIDQEIKKQGQEQRCKSKGVGCMGLCAEGPLVSTDSGVLYKRVTASDASAIVASVEAEPVSQLLCRTDIPFFQRQKKIVLENSGVVDPERIEDYIAANGYSAMMRVLTEMSPSRWSRKWSRADCAGAAAPAIPPV